MPPLIQNSSPAAPRALRQLPSHIRLLTLVSRSRLTKENINQAGQLLSKGINWKRFILEMQYHRLCIPFSRQIKALSGHQIPAEHARMIRDISIRQKLTALNHTRLVIKIAKQFALHGIRVIFLKGVCLSRILYQDSASRHSGDIDLMICLKDFYRAEACLLRLGCIRIDPPLALDAGQLKSYAKIRFHTVYRTPDHTLVELHWQLCNTPGIFETDFNTLWGGRAELFIAGTPIAVPDHPHNFIFLLVHGAKHAWERLFWVKDIADYIRLLSPGDWDAIWGMVEKNRLSHQAREALILAETLFQAPVPVHGLKKWWAEPFFLGRICRGYAASRLAPDKTLMPYLRKLLFFNRFHRFAYIKSAFLSCTSLPARPKS